MKVKSLAEQLFFTTVLIECSVDEESVSVGTAFIISAQHENKHGAFLVTNKHVVAGAAKGVLRFHLKDGGGPNLKQGYKLNVAAFSNYWIGHPDPDVDVTVMSMSMILEQAKSAGKELYFKSIPEKICPTPEQAANLDAIEEVTFVGYPEGIYDQAHYLPVARRGITASPIQVDHDAKRKFLIDASVFPGSSGSPVLILDKGMYATRDAVVLGGRTHFLGVLAAVHVAPTESKVILRPQPTASPGLVAVGSRMLNLGIVYKWNTVFDLARSLLTGERIK